MSKWQYIYNFHFITILGKAPDEDDIRIAKTTPGNDDQGAKAAGIRAAMGDDQRRFQDGWASWLVSRRG